jgi:hypothetical protein
VNYLFGCVGGGVKFGKFPFASFHFRMVEALLAFHWPGSCDPRNYNNTTTGMSSFEHIYKTTIQDIICVVIVIIVIWIRTGTSHKVTRRGSFVLFSFHIYLFITD